MHSVSTPSYDDESAPNQSTHLANAKVLGSGQPRTEQSSGSRLQCYRYPEPERQLSVAQGSVLGPEPSERSELWFGALPASLFLQEILYYEYRFFNFFRGQVTVRVTVTMPVSFIGYGYGLNRNRLT